MYISVRVANGEYKSANSSFGRPKNAYMPYVCKSAAQPLKRGSYKFCME